MLRTNKLFAFVALMVISITLIGCNDYVIELSPEEEKRQMQEYSALFEGIQLPEFEVSTIDGKTVTSTDCFQNHKITMINIWGTFCGPCIEEMPYIAKLYDNLPEGTNIISICTDANESKETLAFAKKVLRKSKADFYTLIPNATLKDALTDRVTSFPTTIFVNSDGKVIGGPHFGADNEESYRASMLDRLALVEEEPSDLQKVDAL